MIKEKDKKLKYNFSNLNKVMTMVFWDIIMIVKTKLY